MIRKVYVYGGAREAEEALGEHADGLKETLFLADTKAALEALTGAGAYAIAIRHEGNADEDFSGARYVFEHPEEIDEDSFVKAYERLSGNPWEILETKRLKLRETTLEDIDAFYELYKPPSMTQYMEPLYADPDTERAYMRTYIEKIYGFLGFGIYTVILKETGEIIGRAGFSVRNGFDAVELGFLIGVPWQGEGYAKEALSALIEYAKETLGLSFLQAFVMEENEVSRGLLRGLGFTEAERMQSDNRTYVRMERQL